MAGILRLFAVLAVGLGALAACGDDDSTVDADAGVVTETTDVDVDDGDGDDRDDDGGGDGEALTVACDGEEPPWLAGEGDLEDVCDAIDLLAGAFTDAGVGVDFDDEDGFFAAADGQEYGIGIVYSLLDTPRSDWADAVDFHVGALLDAADSDLPVDYADAEPQLRVLLYDDATFASVDPVRRELTPTVSATVVYDVGSSVGIVPSAQLDTWGVGADEVFDTALAQTLVALPDLLGDPSTVVAAASDDIDTDFYKTTWLLDPAPLLGNRFPDGALIVVPARDEFIIHAIEPGEGIGWVHTLRDGAGESYEASKTPITDSLFWWNGETLLELPVVEGNVVMPGELGAVLDGSA